MSGNATAPQQQLLMCMGTAVGPANFLSLPKNSGEGDETPICACPEKGYQYTLPKEGEGLRGSRTSSHPQGRKAPHLPQQHTEF